MRGIGYALILFGIISTVIILLYGATIGWSGLTGSIVAVIAGVGFLSMAGDGCREKNNSCGCNRY